MTLKTLNGSFRFRVRKYVLNGDSTNWLQLSQTDLSAHYESRLLRDFALDKIAKKGKERTTTDIMMLQTDIKDTKKRTIYYPLSIFQVF